MACLLAKVDNPAVDPRKPYRRIGSADAFSGRSYDERYIARFVITNRLPLNRTTGFLTPGFRVKDRPLTTDVPIEGNPPELYVHVLHLLNDVYTGRVSAEDLLTEIIRVLLIIRNERQTRLENRLAAQRSSSAPPLSSEDIVTLIGQHLASKYAARLPVLVVAAAYHAVGERVGEQALPLQEHNAADVQTGASGDVEIVVENEDQVVTVYEMKTRRVTMNDIDLALEKIADAASRIDNYLFVTTEAIDREVNDYARTAYDRTGGTEVAILDCLGFLRHFLHFFHRYRMPFLDAYQALVLAEPDSAVSQPLKEAFLNLRQAAQAG
jgi:hypothetical protein